MPERTGLSAEVPRDTIKGQLAGLPVLLRIKFGALVALIALKRGNPQSMAFGLDFEAGR